MVFHLQLGASSKIDGWFSSATQSSISKSRCMMKLSLSEPVKNRNTYGLFCFVVLCFFFSFSVLRQYQVLVEFIEFSGFYAGTFITFSFAEPFFEV